MIVGNNPDRTTIRCTIDINPNELQDLIEQCGEWEVFEVICVEELPSLRTIQRTLEAIKWAHENVPQVMP
jgi:hypothetical protein